MNTLLQLAAGLLFPKARCLTCDEPRRIDAGDALCANCLADLDKLLIPDSVCPRCLSPAKAGQACDYCEKGGMGVMKRAFAPYVYGDLVRKLILMMKFGPVEDAAAPLCREMALCVSGIRFDALVPVPLHPARERERGMNQSRLLCGLISDQTGFPTLEALGKTRNIARQSALPREERERNVKGAFTAARGVRGMDILLVDDVRTSGATARECAGVLMEAGAASVCLLTAAVANLGEDKDEQ